MDYAAIWEQAEAAGQKALAAYTEQYGYDRGSCGFAWIEIKPARGPFVTWCKKANAADTSRKSTPYGDNGWNGGWVLWAPGTKGYSGQSVNAIEAGARGFANVLEENGIKCHVGSRLD
jgi:hypothetical protein